MVLRGAEAAAAAVAVPAPAPAAALLGLQKSTTKATAGSKSRPAPVKPRVRTGPIWATVVVLEQEMSQTPKVKCLGCSQVFCGGRHVGLDSGERMR